MKGELYYENKLNTHIIIDMNKSIIATKNKKLADKNPIENTTL